MRAYAHASAIGLIAAVAFSLPAGADESATIPPKSLSAHPCIRSSAYTAVGGVTSAGGGATMLSFTVATDGSVKDIAVASSSGNETLDETAKSCVSAWKYRAATKDGVAVEVPWKAVVSWRTGRSR
jgi:TonB family protein